MDVPVENINIPAIHDAVKSLPIGEISDPIRVNINDTEQWYILRVDNRKPAEAPNFEKHKDRVKADYEAAHAKPLSEITKAQAEKSNVVVVDPRFQDLNEVYSPAPTNLPGFGAEQPEGAQPPAQGTTPPAQGSPPPAGSGGQ